MESPSTRSAIQSPLGSSPGSGTIGESSVSTSASGDSSAPALTHEISRTECTAPDGSGL